MTVLKCSRFLFQIFGGNGFNSEYPVEKLMRDAKIYQVGHNLGGVRGGYMGGVGYMCCASLV